MAKQRYCKDQKKVRRISDEWTIEKKKTKQQQQQSILKWQRRWKMHRALHLRILPTPWTHASITGSIHFAWQLELTRLQ